MMDRQARIDALDLDPDDDKRLLAVLEILKRSADNLEMDQSVSEYWRGVIDAAADSFDHAVWVLEGRY
jgi:hypothetical protein